MNEQFGNTGGYRQASAAPRIKEKIAGPAAEVKQRFVKLGQRAADTVDARRHTSADRLEETATFVNRQGQRVASIAQTVARKLQATAGYIREHEAREMMDDARVFIRRHPGQSFCAAVAVGYIVGRVASGRD